jgi:hypothetical protein
MARPRKADADRSGPPLAVRLTSHERTRLAGEAARLRLPVSVMVRQRALAGDVGAGLTVTQVRELAAVDRVTLTRLGVNLNQIARVLNEQGGPAVVDLHDDLRTTLAGINAVLMRGAGDDSGSL